MQAAAPPLPHAATYSAELMHFEPAQPSAPPLPPHHVEVAVGTPAPYASVNYDPPQQQRGLFYPPPPPGPYMPQQQEQRPPPMYYPHAPQAQAGFEQHQHVAATAPRLHAVPVSHQQIWGKMYVVNVYFHFLSASYYELFSHYFDFSSTLVLAGRRT